MGFAWNTTMLNQTYDLLGFTKTAQPNLRFVGFHKNSSTQPTDRGVSPIQKEDYFTV
jgi:hypothetical protein